MSCTSFDHRKIVLAISVFVAFHQGEIFHSFEKSQSDHILLGIFINRHLTFESYEKVLGAE